MGAPFEPPLLYPNSHPRPTSIPDLDAPFLIRTRVRADPGTRCPLYLVGWIDRASCPLPELTDRKSMTVLEKEAIPEFNELMIFLHEDPTALKASVLFDE